MFSKLSFTVFAFSAVALTSQVHAGSRSWVSNTGTDSGTCLVAVPCRTFQYAHDHTDAGGEIDVKDSGGFGSVVITKAITIVAPDGVLATIGVPKNSTGITVNAGLYDDITIRGLTINAFKADNSTDILISSAGPITIDHCNILGGRIGIDFEAANRSTFTYNLIDGNYFALKIRATGATVLSSNVITNNTYGIDNETSLTYAFKSNLLANNIYDLIGNNLIFGNLN